MSQNVQYSLTLWERPTVNSEWALSAILPEKYNSRTEAYYAKIKIMESLLPTKAHLVSLNIEEAD